MALSAKLQLRQSQSLVMTPQLMQSIRLLQLTQAELEQFIEQEIERNPLIERADDDAPLPGEESPMRAQSDVEAADCADLLGNDAEYRAVESVQNELDAPRAGNEDDDGIGPGPVSPALQDQWRSAGAGSVAGGEGFDLEQVTAAPVTLADHIAEQIAFAGFSPAERLIAAELADWVDEAGYMRGDCDEIAQRLGTETDQVKAVLRGCQEFDPPGLFAGDLAQCLALQCERKNRLDPAMRTMLDNLDLLARRDYTTLQKLCSLDAADIIDMAGEIRGLDPRPGAVFTSGTANVVVPDVYVRAAPDGGWNVELNADTLPRVLVNQDYYTKVARNARDGEREFLSDCMQNANWLVRSLDQRARTILKVSSEIVRQQDAFFVNGVQHLRPLNLKTVAEAIKMHESTVSRVTSNKYMATPRGVFELKYFFTAAIASVSAGETHSSEAVRDRIRRMIDTENHDAVLSDDAIVEELKSSGIDIARRTVAKYRDAMNIPSSVQRRREKRALAAAQA